MLLYSSNVPAISDRTQRVSTQPADISAKLCLSNIAMSPLASLKSSHLRSTSARLLSRVVTNSVRTLRSFLHSINPPSMYGIADFHDQKPSSRVGIARTGSRYQKCSLVLHQQHGPLRRSTRAIRIHRRRPRVDRLNAKDLDRR